MALSNIYTGTLFWNAATREIKAYKQNDLVYAERFNLINQACQITQGLVADVVAEAYKRDTVAVLSTTGKYGTTGTFTASTRALVATMDSSWSSVDIGNLVILRTGTTVYLGTVESYVSTTSVVLVGDNLPSTNVASFDTITMVGTTPTGSVISIASLRLLRYGSQLRLQLLSTATNSVLIEPSESFPRWRSGASQNLETIVWCLVGTLVYINKGDTLSSYGTLTFRYPALPDLIALDASYIDLIDGTMIQTGILVLKSLIEKRLGVPPNNAQPIIENVQSIYRC